MESYTPSQLKKKLGSRCWISPYQKIVATYDPRVELIEVHEYHARGKCIGGAAWEVYHYPNVSPLVVEAKREGARNIFRVKIGDCNLKLRPGIAGAGMERVEVSNGEIRMTYAGLAGGGLAATLCRGMAEGVKRIQVHQAGGGSKLGRASLVLPLKEKLIVGMDDTDRRGEGATWALANELGTRVEEERLADYLEHAIVQLYTQNPFKTTNCVSIALTFAVKPSRRERLVKRIQEFLKQNTFSTETGMAIYAGIYPPEKLRQYAERVKICIVKLQEAEKTAKTNGVQLISITGKRGMIGALAAIAYATNPDEAVRVLA